MQEPKLTAKDPSIGVGLAFLFPGLGHLYAGKPGTFAVFLAVEIWLLVSGRLVALAVVHVFQAVAAGGAVKLWNQTFAPTGGVDVPPPPPASREVRTPSPPPPEPAAPPPPPAMAPLDAEAFLSELQSSWREHRAGELTAREFADRKWRAIRALAADDADEADAVVAAARELAASGVLTSEEIGQLEARVAR